MNKTGLPLQLRVFYQTPHSYNMNYRTPGCEHDKHRVHPDKDKGEQIMSNTTKIIFLLLLIIYTISPVDCMPGPVDDIILWIIYGIAQKKLSDKD